MAYTPINWQTGDTITAEKMNKMDNGWSMEETQLFSESVTTVAEEWGNDATFSYDQFINSDVITVTFNGTDYECNRLDFGDYIGYGGMTETDPDFSQYPFANGTVNYAGLSASSVDGVLS